MSYRTSSHIFLTEEDVHIGPGRLDLYDATNDRWVPLGYCNNVRATIMKGDPAILEANLAGAATPFKAHRTLNRAEITGNLQEIWNYQALGSVGSGNTSIVFETDNGVGMEEVAVPLHNFEWQEVPASVAMQHGVLPTCAAIPTVVVAVSGGTVVDRATNRISVYPVYLGPGELVENAEGDYAAKSTSATFATASTMANESTLTVTVTKPSGVKPSGYVSVLHSLDTPASILATGLVCQVTVGGGDATTFAFTVTTQPVTPAAFVSAGFIALVDDGEPTNHIVVKSIDGVTTYSASTDYNVDTDTGFVRRISGSTIPSHAQVQVRYPVRVQSQMTVRIGTADQQNTYYGIRFLSLGTDENGYGEGWAFYFLRCYLQGSDWEVQATPTEFFEGSPFRFMAVFPREAAIPALGYVRRWSGFLSGDQDLEDSLNADFVVTGTQSGVIVPNSSSDTLGQPTPEFG